MAPHPSQMIYWLNATVSRMISLGVVSLWSLLATSLFNSTALAQYRFDQWKADTGLPQNSIHSIHRTRDGYLLYRVRKQVITTYSKQHGLVDSNVYPIYEDRAGAIRIGAWYMGLSRYKDGAFTSYTKRAGLASALVTAIGEDRDGRLWVAAYGDAERSGLRVFEQGRFTVSGDLATLNGQVSAIFQDRAGALSLGTDHGLAQYQDGALTTWTTKDGLSGYACSKARGGFIPRPGRGRPLKSP